MVEALEIATARDAVHAGIVKASGTIESPEPTPRRRSKKLAQNASEEATPTIQEEKQEEGSVVAVSSGKGKRRKSVSQSMTATRTLPLLVCSVGNPGKTYADTLHSAGHTVVNKLGAHLGYLAFNRERVYGNGLVSKPPITGSSGDWTLWQSTSYMNESGKGLKAAYNTWAKNILVGEEGKVVVIYDELEKPLGSVTVRTAQGLSARGHNGLKSIISDMRDVPFARIGIGIGRPVSRESNDVARYVLKKMTPPEKETIESSVEEVVKKLQQLEKG